MQDHPLIYIKSHPIGTGQETYIELHLTTTNIDRKAAEKEMDQAIIEISILISKRGGKDTRLPCNK
jgi:hypothetical protein